jgi:CheY-like chemotaxis protein
MSKELYIVDDNPDHQFLMYKILKHIDKPYSFKFFDDGKLLYRHLNAGSQRNDYHHFPGLIILDLNMPGMNGVELLRLIKHPTIESHEFLKQIPVVIMSNDIREEKMLQCYQTGANAYIIKPLGYEQIKSIMKGICRFWLEDPSYSE